MKGGVLLSVFFLLLTCLSANGQELIIGRTTGVLQLPKGVEVGVYGFTNTLSGQVTLPGTTLELISGDSIVVDFWNISQGDPHVIFIDSVELDNRTQEGLPALQEEVYHMEHAYYHFKAPAPGTYLYYCSENYPVNMHAGMFGVMIVRDSIQSLPIPAELLWCSFERDTVWHNNATSEEVWSRKSQEDLPYKPQYFLLNGTPIKDLGPLLLSTDKKKPTLIRLVNAGQWQHRISFPKELNIRLLGEKNTLVQGRKGAQQLILDPRETAELLLFPPAQAKRLRVKYEFLDPLTNRIKHRANIAVH